MGDDTRAGTVETVLGPIPASELGVTSPHEHLILDPIGERPFTLPTGPAEYRLALEPVTLENLWWVRHNYTRNRDNVVLRDESQAATELGRFRAAGGRTLVDATPWGLGRDPEALARLARATGVHVIMGSGYYVGTHHPPAVAAQTIDEIADGIMGDALIGSGDTGIRSGTIGEIGCSWPVEERELKVLRAAGRAQRSTGLSLIVHPGRHERALVDHVRVLEAEGVDPQRVVMAHVDRRLRRGAGLLELARVGCFISFDCFGLEPWNSPEMASMPQPCDLERVDDILWLADAGFLDQLLIAQDVAMKHRLACYGGHGYDHLLRNVAPLLASRGLGDDGVRRLLIENPRRMLAIT